MHDCPVSPLAALLWCVGVLLFFLAIMGTVAGFREEVSFFRLLRKRSGSTTGAIIGSAIFWCMVAVGAYKSNLLPRSSANPDAGITLVAVTAVNTNGLTTITAVSRGNHATPMWYRDSTSNDWTLATLDGFEHTYSGYLPEAQHFSNVWTRAEEDYDVRVAYWFGDDPPAVEVVAEGGIYMDVWHATGRGVDVQWHIDDGVVITEGSRVILEYGFGPGNTWASVASCEVSPGNNRSGTLSVRGWFVSFATRWRLKLEVPR